MMGVKQSWAVSLWLLVTAVATGSAALSINGGNGNALLYLLFWLSCTTLFGASSYLLTKCLPKLFSKKFVRVLLTVLCTLIGFVSSSPIGLMGLLGLLVLFLFFPGVVLLLLLSFRKFKTEFE